MEEQFCGAREHWPNEIWSEFLQNWSHLDSVERFVISPLSCFKCQHSPLEFKPVFFFTFQLWVCNTPNWVQNRESSCRTHSSVIHLRKWRSLAHGTSCCQPCHSQAAQKVAQQRKEPSSETLVHMRATAMSFRPLWTIGPRFVLDRTTWALWISHSQLSNKSTTDTPILHAQASFISAERGRLQRILSRTSFKCYNHIGSFPKLTIFIFKQLKRSAAFSAMHCLWKAVFQARKFSTTWRQMHWTSFSFWLLWMWIFLHLQHEVFNVWVSLSFAFCWFVAPFQILNLMCGLQHELCCIGAQSIPWPPQQSPATCCVLQTHAKLSFTSTWADATRELTDASMASARKTKQIATAILCWRPDMSWHPEGAQLGHSCCATHACL